MKRAVTILLAALLAVALMAGAAWAKPDAAKGKGVGLKALQQAQEVQTNENGQSDQVFLDIQGHWANKTIVKMKAMGLLAGYEDNTFRPDKPLTQAEAVVLIERIVAQAKKDKKDKSTSDDQDTGDDEELTDDGDAVTEEDSNGDDDELDKVPGWAKNAVKKAAGKGFVNLKRFHSDVQASRAMACIALAKQMEAEGLLEVEDITIADPFKDFYLFAQLDGFEEDDYKYIIALYNAGIIKGTPSGNFNPNSFITRAEMSVIIEKMLDENMTSTSVEENDDE